MEFKHTVNLRLSLDLNSFDTIFPLPDLPALPLIPNGYSLFSQTLEILNFKAYSKINSLPSASLPSFQLEDSETDRLYKSLDLEWKSPRKQLNLLFGSVGNWQLAGSISLLNPAGYPYRIYDLLQIYSASKNAIFGINNKLAIQIQDVGWGTLNEFDKVSVWCDILQSVYLVPPPTTVTNTVNNTTTSTSNPSSENDEYMLIPKDSNFTAEMYRSYLLKAYTTEGVVTLPANPPDGSYVEFVSDTEQDWKILLADLIWEGIADCDWILLNNSTHGIKLLYTNANKWRPFPFNNYFGTIDYY